MIQHTVRHIALNVFFAICATCGEEGPDAPNQKDAHVMALQNDWTYQTILADGEQETVYTCPKCKEGK